MSRRRLWIVIVIVIAIQGAIIWGIVAGGEIQHPVPREYPY